MEIRQDINIVMDQSWDGNKIGLNTVMDQSWDGNKIGYKHSNGSKLGWK